MLQRRFPLYVKILIGMAVGLLLGSVAEQANVPHLITDWIAPWGEIFLRLLKLIALPLVLVSLIKGLGGMNDIAKLTHIGIRTMGLYVVTTLFAITIGVTLAFAIQPGRVVSEEASALLTQSYEGDFSSKLSGAAAAEQRPPLQFLVDMVPSNAFEAMTQNSAMLQIIVLALLVGIAAILIGPKKSAPFINFMDSLDAILLKIIDIVMLFAPIGVAGLMANLVVDTAGDTSILGALGLYALTVTVALCFLMFLVYPLVIRSFTSIKVLDFIKALLPVQLVAFSTSSSAATLSTTMKMTDEKLKLPKHITSFTLPIGVTINMDGTSCYQAISVVFIAQTLGIDLSLAQILTIIGTSTLASIGTPGVPGGSIVISMMILTAIGIPPEGLILVLGIDRPLDMLRTAVNVTGDTVVSALISKYSGKSKEENKEETDKIQPIIETK